MACSTARWWSSNLGGWLSQWITPLEVPTIIARFFDITKDEYNDLSSTNRSELVEIAKKIDLCTGAQATFYPGYIYRHEGSKIVDQRIIQSLTEQGERLIDAVRHDDYHTMHRTLRELQERLSSKYEFTVFAATRDYHSVNFGLINTYRQALGSRSNTRPARFSKPSPWLQRRGAQVLGQDHTARQALDQGGPQEQHLDHQRTDLHLAGRSRDHGQGPEQDQLHHYKRRRHKFRCLLRQGHHKLWC